MLLSRRITIEFMPLKISFAINRNENFHFQPPKKKCWILFFKIFKNFFFLVEFKKIFGDIKFEQVG